MEKPNLLSEKYKDLAGSKPVERAVSKGIRQGEKGATTKEDRIAKYLDRLEQLVLDPQKQQRKESLDGQSRPRALTLLREVVLNKYVRPHKTKIAESAARVEERAAREMGIEAQYGQEELVQRGDIAIADLEKSLDAWILYLSDANGPYPTWFRYYVFRNILDLGDFDKDKGEFTKRTPGSFRLFPDIDRGALAYIQQMIEASKNPEVLRRLQEAQKAIANQDIPADQVINQEKVSRFANLSFAKQYAEGIKTSGEITPEMRQETRGQWVKYQKGTDPTALWASLQNKGTAWCTKGFATAEKQLEGGDFYVYYTLDRQGKPTIPRIAIRMQEDSIGEVRGTADNQQNLEGNMTAIAEAKMSELPGAERYKKASADMRRMTILASKYKNNEPLTKDDLVFLYEMDAPIAYFGYQKDPRIEEIRSQRNPEEDMLTIFDCSKEEIATNPDQATEQTKAYLGPWDPTIAQTILKYPSIKHLYESFPDKKIFIKPLETDPTINSAQKARQILGERGINISDYAKDLLEKTQFNPEKKTYKLAKFSVAQLGFKNGATTQEIYDKAQELGLDLCPAEIGPQLRLQYMDQPLNEWIYIAMKQIADRDGYPEGFSSWHAMTLVYGCTAVGRSLTLGGFPLRVSLLSPQVDLEF